MKDLNVKIAGETFCLKYRNPQIPLFFSDYIIDSTGEIPICPTDDELNKIRADFVRTDSKRFIELPNRSSAQLEFHTIHYVMAKAILKRGLLLVHGSAVAADGQA